MPEKTDHQIEVEKKAAAVVAGQYPKVLADATGKDRDDKHVHNAAEEAAARADGFTRVVTTSTGSVTKAPVSLEYPRMVYHKDHGYRTVRLAQEHKEALADGWQDEPLTAEETKAAGDAAVDHPMESRVRLLETKVASLERNQQGAAPVSSPNPTPAKKV